MDFLLIQALEFWEEATTKAQQTRRGTMNQLSMVSVAGFTRKACGDGVLTEDELLSILVILRRAYGRTGVGFSGVEVPGVLPADFGDETKGDSA